jgi:LEA14-like dessication related protein
MVQSECVRSHALVASLLLAACSRPKPPTITPEKAVVTVIAPSGIEMNVELAVDNPNGVDLSARSVTANVVLDHHLPLRTVTVPHEFKLTARSTSHLVIPMSLKWEDVSTLLTLAAANRNIPYDIDGSVRLGGDLLHADVPFRLSGALTHDELVRTTLNSLPGVFP